MVLFLHPLPSSLLTALPRGSDYNEKKGGGGDALRRANLLQPGLFLQVFQSTRSCWRGGVGAHAAMPSLMMCKHML